MSARSHAALPVLLALAASAFALPAAAQNSSQPTQPAAGAPAPVPADVPGAIALLTLFNPASAKPSIKGDFAALTISLPNTTRTQQVYLSGRVYTWRGVRVREVLTYAQRLTGAPDPALAVRLLAESDGTLPTGSWVLVAGGGDTRYVAYEAFIQVDATASLLQGAVNDAAIKADKLELELTNKDDF